MKNALGKTFVIDTNVILHDARCLLSFGKGDIAIPITVLEEVDRFKRGSENIHAQARRFLRSLDEITGDLLSEQGAPLGEDMGSVRVIISPVMPDQFRDTFIEDSPDHRILATALHISEHKPKGKVIFVSKDVNLRMKAKSLGIIARDYTSDKVEEPDQLYQGKRTIEQLDPDVIDLFFDGDGSVPASKIQAVKKPIPNEFFIFKHGSKSVLSQFYNRAFHKVGHINSFGLKPRNAEQAFALAALLNDDIKLVTIAGKAGTGKTILALAAALQQRRNYRQILLARPVVALSNKDLGYLPGDISDKLDPYMQPLFDNLSVLKHLGSETDNQIKKISDMQDQGKIKVTPLAYIRGRSLPDVYFIVDEAQNLSPHEIKTIITRAGEGTKIVFTGDVQQIDQPYLDQSSNGLSYVISRMKGQNIYAHISLEKGERSLLADIASDLL